MNSYDDKKSAERVIYIQIHFMSILFCVNHECIHVAIGIYVKYILFQ